ncbi:MAG: hypothetical protein ABFS16_13890 [Bacteroidota bacterium]
MVKNLYKFSIVVLFFLIQLASLYAQTEVQDSIPSPQNDKMEEQFYDSLEYKANQQKLTRILYDFLVTPPRPYVDKKALALDYYGKHDGKLISEIKIKALDVFGPNFNDTTRKAKSLFEKTANTIHTKSNLRTIEKLLLFKAGDFLDPELMFENERLIRELPYIKDMRFVVEQDSLYPGLVKIMVLTKDRFSFGASGGVNGMKSADIVVYNKNVFGVGHELSLGFVGHVNRQPYLGFETFYKIKNIDGKFLDISAGYLNTYKNEGLTFMVDKPFITTKIKWGYGLTAIRMFRTDKIFEDDPVLTDIPLDLAYYCGWLGRSFNLNPERAKNTQLVLTAGMNNWTYYGNPLIEPYSNHFFADRTLYMAGITFAQRRYIQDQLIYSYGITEDIPEGFKNEILYGYDANEFGDRHYAHIFLSNGNLLINRKGYLYLSAGIGGYIRNKSYEQGQIQGSVNFISRMFNAGRKRLRLFTNVDYMLGINRFEIENLTLSRDDRIRGFRSKEVIGQQRLSMKLEHVLFLRRELYKFNMAFYGFADVGIIGSSNQLIFTQDYYSGLGIGLRLHNENFVLQTFRIRLAFYPFHPDDMNLVGFILNEQMKGRFYSFEPTAPHPLPFE